MGKYGEITIRYNSDEKKFEKVKVLQVDVDILHDIEQIYLTNAKKIHPKNTGKYFKPVEVIKNTTSFGVTIDNKRITGIGLHWSGFSTLPESIGNLSSLQVLSLNSNKLSSLPESIKNLTSLSKLSIYVNQFKELPKSIKELISLRELDIAGNPFVEFPESIFDLENLRKLNIGSLQLKTIPESIKNLSLLQELRLDGSQLISLPESIGELKSLQSLNLDGNQLISLPESIGELKSLQSLNLDDNRLTSLPESLYKLENLENLRLNGNIWKGEWTNIEKKDIPTVLGLCRKLNGMNIFISHAWNDQEKYQVKALKDYLENSVFINDLGKDFNIIHEAFLCEETFIDDIRKFMKENVPKSHILLFIATNNSIISEACRYELFLANKYGIEILPIKGMDINWEELSQITCIDLNNNTQEDLNLSNPKERFEFTSKNFKKIWKNLGNYITKHEFGLKKNQEENKELENIKSLIINITNSQEIKDKLKKNLKDFNRISQELNRSQITSIEYCLKLGQLLNQKKDN